MRYLLDVNVLLAWGWSDHSDHRRTSRWIASLAANDLILTSAIPQLGFVRVSVQRTGGLVSVQEAGQVLAGMLECLGTRHRFLPDDCNSFHLPGWCKASSCTTDAHLLLLARDHGAVLATLDTRIPDAFLIPSSKAT